MIRTVRTVLLLTSLAGLGIVLAAHATRQRPVAQQRRVAAFTRQPAGTDTTGAISVHGEGLLRDGAPWVPRGVQIVGLVAPTGSLWGKYVAAHAHFGRAELAAALAEHADLVRIQVSEFGLDPDSPLYSPAYVSEVESGVELARSLGLDVDLSLQAEPSAGEPTRCPLPDPGAERAWNELAPMFAGDAGVMFELYNEPAVSADADGWRLWRDGGLVSSRAETCDAVGIQSLIDDIRADGADNVIVVPGAEEEATLAGMPQLEDPANPLDPQLVYGIHYPSMRRGVTAWNAAFGAASARVPVLVTEWDANSMRECLTDTPADATLLLDYLASRRIGVVGFAFDLPGTIVANYSGTPTSYRDFACGQAGDGPGRTLFRDYAGEAASESTTGAEEPSPAILGVGALRRLVAEAPGTTSHLDTPMTFVTGANTSTLARLAVPNAVPTTGFASETALGSAVEHDRLRPGTRAVVLALGADARTPLAEQRDPSAAYERAADVAHAHRLLLVAAPQLDLVRAVDPDASSEAREQAAFLRARIAGAAARYADVYVVEEANAAVGVAGSRAFARRASAQATAAHPGIELIQAQPAATSWRPLPRSGDSFYWEIDPPRAGLAGLPPIRARYPAPGSARIWDTDLFEDANTSHGQQLEIPTGPSPIVSALHAAGHYAVCYVEAGAYQTGYPDDRDYAPADYGNRAARYRMQGYANEWWLDIAGFRSYAAGRPSTLHGAAINIARALGKRLAWCRLEGQDAVEPDDLDGYTNRGATGVAGAGWGLTRADSRSFERWLADTAHTDGLAIIQKNDPANARVDEPLFDGVLSEECNFYHDPCAGPGGDWNAYLKHHKPVLNAEYIEDGETTRRFCPADRHHGIWGALFDVDLDGARGYRVCWSAQAALR